MDKLIKILIADDNIEICDVLKKYLSSIENFEVCSTTTNGIEALNQIYTLKPDVILLDIMMPELDGLGVLKRLKETPPIKMPKIIMLTARGEDEFTRESFARGANYYIIKPFSLDSLTSAIAFVMNCKQPIIEPATSTENTFNELIRKSVIDLGIHTNVLGYQYILEALNIMTSEPCIGNLVKNIYNRIANDNSTTPQCVESAIRNAITQANYKKTSFYKKIFFDNCDDENVIFKRPSNSVFLSKVVEYIKILNTKNKDYELII